MIRVTQERSFAGMGWATKPAIVVARNYTGPSTQRQAHDWYEYTGDTSTKRKTNRKVQREREGATLREESMAVWQVCHYRWMRALRGEMTMRSIHWSPSRGLYPHSDM